jgi:hypothetical protein
MGSGAKSYRRGFLIYEEMRKFFPIYEEAVSHILLCTRSLLISLYMRKILSVIYSHDQSAYSAAGKYVDRSWEYINGSQTHKCGNWD